MKTNFKTLNEWIESTHILAENQLGVELDSGKIKLGDGISFWVDLDYIDYEDYIATNKNIVAPEDFGELSSDDTNIIQAALNSEKNVRFTSGVTYNVSGEFIVPSNTIVSGHGAKLCLIPNSNSVKKVFKVEDGSKNVIFDGLTFESVRSEIGVKINSDNKQYFKDSNRECISLYQGVENIVVRNCKFNGVTYCVTLQAHENPLIEDICRKNIVIENLWAKDVSCAIDGGRETDGLFINNVHIETVPCSDLHHSIYLQTNIKNARINNFYINQRLATAEEMPPACDDEVEAPSTGTPISIYTSGVSTDICTQPIYISNGEIHAASMGAASNPYVIYADNVHFINNDTNTVGSVYSLWEESFGYFNNCTFENCTQLRNGVFTGCRFKLYPGGNNGLIYVYGKAKKKNVDNTFDDSMINVNLSDVERTVLKDCIIDMNNAERLINLDVMDSENEETGNQYRIRFDNCNFENFAENPSATDKLIYTSKNINTPYTITFDDCTFNTPFNKDLYYSYINENADGRLDIVFNDCSLKSNQSDFIKACGNKVTKTYTMCDLNGVVM